jgi:hypothetical protein
MMAFARDTGSWTVTSGALAVTAESLGQDAVAVWYHDEYLPVYYEIDARVLLSKPTAGWKANAYVIFDYWGPNDFKFAGLDDSTNKLVMGYRDASGWHVVAQSSIPGGVKYDRWYDLLVAINGTNVTVRLNNSEYFSYTFAPRVVDNVQYGLNKGLLGFGSDNSRGMFDNIALQILPPTLTLDRTEDFAGGAADLFGTTTGTWQITAERYEGDSTGLEAATAHVDLGKTLAYDAYLELETLAVSGTDRVGLVFDYYSDVDFKYAMVDIAGDLIVLGHRTPSGWIVDATTAWALADGVDHLVKITLKGAGVNVVVDGQTIFGYGYNSPLVDGAFGILTDGTGSFDNVRVRTNDPGFDEYDPGGSLVSVSDAVVVEGDAGTTDVIVTIGLDVASTEAITVSWVTGPGTALGDVDFIVVSGSVTFAPGETSKTIIISVLGDLLDEADETFSVQLSEITGPATIDDGMGIVTIVDDDDATPPPPADVEMSIDDFSFTEKDKKTTTIRITVNLSTAATEQITVDYVTVQSGDATQGLDYEYASGTLTFDAGQTSATISVQIINDKLLEGDETFTVVLSNVSSGATIIDNTAIVTIIDDESLLTVSMVGTGATPIDSNDPAIATAFAAALGRWSAEGFSIGGLTVVVADLSSAHLASVDEGRITIDADAAGWGWTFNGGAVDLVTVLEHEVGHVLGFMHTDAARFEIMASEIDPIVVFDSLVVGVTPRITPAQATATSVTSIDHVMPLASPPYDAVVTEIDTGVDTSAVNARIATADVLPAAPPLTPLLILVIAASLVAVLPRRPRLNECSW